MAAGRIYIGTAGWSIPRESANRVHGDGTHLQRYARVLRCAEINSPFHRPHATQTYAKWAALTPRGFRFAVKLPRTITHDLRLRSTRLALERFLQEGAGLGGRRGPLLVQLPLEALAHTLRHAAASAAVWCLFDNTASGAALANALDLHALTSASRRTRVR